MKSIDDLRRHFDAYYPGATGCHYRFHEFIHIVAHYQTGQEAYAAYALLELRRQHKALDTAELTTVLINLFGFDAETALQVTVEGVYALAARDLMSANMVETTELSLSPAFDADLAGVLEAAKLYASNQPNTLTDVQRPLHPPAWTSRPAWMDQAFQEKLRMG
ncbi:MAG TPA: hypothetical protein VNG90_02430 [Candidatus Acidoferrum sp.]|nr:hypothetical protein [Candidatus Acidoferrum sp.]